MSRKFNFVIVDDSKLDCFIAEKIIRNTGSSEAIHKFFDAQQALNAIKNNELSTELKTVFIVDIYMPLMTGFEFVEEFEKFPESVRNLFWIYILSSSNNETDLERVNSYKSVKHFLNKPLTTSKLLELLEEDTFPAS